MKSENSTAQIKCTNYSHIHFSQSLHIHITDLEFIGCGGNQVKHVEEFVIRDTTFRGQENSGTALELIESTAQIVNSTFVANRKGSYKKCDPDFHCLYYDGGAIIATNSTIDISQSKFEYNGADFGGALFAVHSIINMSGCVFINNSAIALGGVLCVIYSNITIEGSEFHNNSATYGGVLHSYSSNLTTEESEFQHNSATRSGGVLDSSRSNITIKESEFHNNSAKWGGVLASYSSNLTSSSSITIKESEFHNNNATRSGGVLYSSSSNITMKESEFHNNNATRYGGVLYSSSSNITIEESEFHNNNATRSGGVLYSSSSNITMKESEFHNNNATRYGGVLYSSSSNITIEESEFHSNSAKWGGVLASFNSNLNYSSSITIEASEFHKNNATRSGGVLYSSSSNITIEASEFHDNSATYGIVLHSTSNNIAIVEESKFRYFGTTFGGGVLLSSSSNITIEKSEFHDNNATMSGGVLHSSSSNITIEESEFYDNSATHGGVLRSISNNITITESEFHGNSATYGGVLRSTSNNIIITESEFHGNSATTSGGVLYSSSSKFTIEESEFRDNSAKWGGVSCSTSSNIAIEDIEFHNNNATYGGVLYSFISNITIEKSDFHNNNVTYEGGVLHFSSSNITIEKSKFHSNAATYGGVLYSSNINIMTIERSGFHNNSATYGGVLNFYNSNITIEESDFHNNNATREGGVQYSYSSNITIGGSIFTKNGSPIGAVMYISGSSRIQHHNYLSIDNNWADRYAVIYLSDSDFIGYGSENVTFSSNLGSLVAFNSNITFVGYARFVNNQPSQTATGDFQEGGAITLLQSNIFFDGVCNLEHNRAENGGAVLSIESKLYVNGDVTITHNTATRNGGGVYLSTSELNCQQMSMIVIFNNTAVHKGGGLHAISSSVKTTSASTYRQYIGTRIIFTKNAAKRGGGLSLEANAKLYVLKYDWILYSADYDTNTAMFIANKADYGGAVYVDDDTNSGTCASDPKTECFFQVLAIHSRESNRLKTQSIYFSQNSANISGSTLYGGLLDRCAVSQFAEVRKKYTAYHYKYIDDGITYFMNVSIPTYYAKKSIPITTNISVSSHPVRVCLCIDNELDCTYQSHIEVKKGETFIVSLAAVDQIGQPVNATIQTSLNFAGSGLAEGQLARKIPAECTDLEFNVVCPHKSENLTLYALDGPCKDAELSKKTIEIHFLPCSCLLGLQITGVNETNCICECHSDISHYVEHCDGHTGSLIKQPQSRAWISYVNDTINLNGYLVYPNCPFDYCLSTSLPINLNKPNGADAQCAFHRSSLLCGSCQPGLSLSLGSSRCLPCPSHWPALLVAITIAAILAGIALVTLLLVLNMTVAVGTVNGLIFYANVVYANKSILLPFQETNFIIVFISWLNLELGIDACYFPGMDNYIKAWIQLAFPAYVILLVVLVIIISSNSSKFSNLIGKKNPVATLATLILLSYAKLIEICFKSLSVGILVYPDKHSIERLWLPDATVKFLSGKHIPLSIVAVLILLVGLVYTALLFSWQWLLYLPKWRIFRWSRNPKIQTFIETYHTPYTPKHRYWTGLLLIVRILLYFVPAINVSNNPTVALIAISFSVCCILALRNFFGSRMYKKWPVDVLDTFCYLNILLFAIFTWYTLDNSDSNQEAAAYTSVIITFIVLLLIILYHVYTYTIVFSKIKETKPVKMIDRLLTDANPKPKPKRHWSPPPDDIHRFNELLDMIDRPVNTNDYKVPLKQKPVKPTQSVVEVHQPYLAPPDPECAAEVVQVGVNEAVSQV